jgi:hypothetical protein
MGYEQYTFTVLFRNDFYVNYVMEYNPNEDSGEFDLIKLYEQFLRKFKNTINKDFDGEIIGVEKLSNRLVFIK